MLKFDGPERYRYLPLAKSNFKLYEQYILSKPQSERIWDQFCSRHRFFSTEMKQRSASLDQPAYSHRRHLQHRATVTIRAP
ncbi:unnamed protein product, partial [Adineta steineri]